MFLFHLFGRSSLKLKCEMNLQNLWVLLYSSVYHKSVYSLLKFTPVSVTNLFYHFLSRSFTCVDKDECQYNPCQGECINTPGSFLCICASGYQLVNKTKCVDVNECQVEGESGCQYRCTNTPGR